MLSSYCSTSSPTFSSYLPLHRRTSSSIRTRPKASSFVCLSIGVQDIAEILQNKVLVAATVSAAIGQLSKPFSSSLLYGKDVDFRSILRAGGFPSTHSAGVVAAATSLGLDRGFSDSIFGMTVIFAALVMYDAQAVRREVGKHAKVLNQRMVFKTQNKPNTNSNNDILTKSEALAPLLSISEKTSTLNSADTPLYRTSENHSSSVPSSSIPSDDDTLLEDSYNDTLAPLEESIGHTLTEVIAGGSLGFLVTLAVYNAI